MLLQDKQSCTFELYVKAPLLGQKYINKLILYNQHHETGLIMSLLLALGTKTSYVNTVLTINNFLAIHLHKCNMPFVL